MALVAAGLAMLALLVWQMRLPGPVDVPGSPIRLAEVPVVEVLQEGPTALVISLLEEVPAGWLGVTARVVGRVAPPGPVQPSAIRHQWPAIYAEVRFDGDAILLAFEDAKGRYRLTLGGDAGAELRITRPGSRILRLTGLGAGVQVLRLEKISESLSDTAGFRGFFVPQGGEALPPPDAPLRQIEFIGDSDTVGLGNTSASRECAGEAVTLATDTSLSFGPRVARYFGADYQIIATSGIGLVRNYDGVSPDKTMLHRYPRLLPDEPEIDPRDGWQPQVIVVMLGSNDFETPLQAGEPWADAEALQADFVARYTRFVQDLRMQSPKALILMVASRSYDEGYLSAHRAVARAMAAQGDRGVDLLVLPPMERTGCLWHPSLRDHARMAQGIIARIAGHPGVWNR